MTLGQGPSVESQGRARLQRGIRKTMSGQAVEAVGGRHAFEELGSEVKEIRQQLEGKRVK